MRAFLTLWIGQFVSGIGSGLTSFAFGVWVYLQTGSVTLFALNILLFTLPGILFTPLIGYVVDRFDRRLVMIVCDAGAGLTTLAVYLLFASGELQFWHVYLATFLNATFNNFQWTAQSAAITLLVPRQHLGRADGLGSLAESITMLAAPALAGALYLSIGLRGIVLIDFATFGFAVFTLLLLRIPKPPVSEVGKSARGTFLQDATFGWRYVRARPGMLGLLLYFASLYFLLGMLDPLLDTMLLDLSGPGVMGWVRSAMGMGALGGALLMSAWGGPKRRALGILLVGVLQGLVMAGFGVNASPLWIGAMVLVFSLLDPIVSGSSQAFWQSKVEPDIQGRVFAVRRMISRLGLLVSLLLAGPLAEKVFEPLLMPGGALAGSLGKWIGVGAGRGTGLLFIVLGLLFTLSSLLALLYAPLRRADSEIPDAKT
jgi:MFS transporter, DHA3 family, macrolide efflux protein